MELGSSTRIDSEYYFFGQLRGQPGLFRTVFQRLPERIRIWQSPGHCPGSSRRTSELPTERSRLQLQRTDRVDPGEYLAWIERPFQLHVLPCTRRVIEWRSIAVQYLLQCFGADRSFQSAGELRLSGLRRSPSTQCQLRVRAAVQERQSFVQRGHRWLAALRNNVLPHGFPVQRI